MAVLKKDQILAAEDLPRETVLVPEWGGEVCIRSMNARERMEWDELDNRDIVHDMLLRTLCDETGELLFQADDLELLKQKSPQVLLRLFHVAAKLNALTLEATETIEKKLESETVAAVLPIASRSNSDARTSI